MRAINAIAVRRIADNRDHSAPEPAAAALRADMGVVQPSGFAARPAVDGGGALGRARDDHRRSVQQAIDNRAVKLIVDRASHAMVYELVIPVGAAPILSKLRPVARHERAQGNIAPVYGDSRHRAGS